MVLRLALLVLPALPLELGCQRPSSPPEQARASDPESERMQRRQLVEYAVKSILEYEKHPMPNSEMLRQSVDRLDQWVRDQKPLTDWQLDPMVAASPEPLLELLRLIKVEELEFPPSDTFALLEAVWLRDVSNWARGDAIDELDQAKRLFDWTVRNVQLEWERGADPGASGLLQKPWETLLFGRGTPTDRAWLFILLARQQRIDAALMACVDSTVAGQPAPRPWVLGVLSQGEVYLFDPTLGLPIPAPDGITRDAAGRLAIQPATLSQVAGNEALLEALHVDAKRRYPVKSSQVQNVVALVEASPAYLAQRMKLLESQLAGDEKLVLTTNPSAQAERFKASRQVADAQLWPVPYQALVQESQLGRKRLEWQQYQLMPFLIGPSPYLWKARQLHFKGLLAGEAGATTFYQAARPSDRQLVSEQADANLKATAIRSKMAASYWLGLIAAHEGNFTAAVDWLSKRTLEYSPPKEIEAPENPWTPGARYNLARVYEAEGQIAKAIEVYRSNADSPAGHGSLLRARWLESTPTPDQPETAPEDRPESGADEQAEATRQSGPETDPGARTDDAAPAPSEVPPEG